MTNLLLEKEENMEAINLFQNKHFFFLSKYLMTVGEKILNENRGDNISSKIPCPFKWSLLLLLGAGGLPLSLEHALHLLPLSFSADVSPETLLGELQATLVFRHLQQLQTALFVRGEADRGDRGRRRK